MMSGYLIFDALVFSDVRIYLRRSTVLRTIIRPDKYPANYQIGSDDYVSVSHLDVQGVWSIIDVSRFTVGVTTDPRNVDLFQGAFKQKGSRRGIR